MRKATVISTCIVGRDGSIIGHKFQCYYRYDMREQPFLVFDIQIIHTIPKRAECHPSSRGPEREGGEGEVLDRRGEAG
jgi:hypothetical protein